jgi:hypothetical protein
MSRAMTAATAVLALAVLTMPAPADASRIDVRIGIGDQHATMFEHPAFQRANFRQVRYFIAWNVMNDRDRRLHARNWVITARRNGARPFLHLSTENLKHGEGRLPTVAQYRREMTRLVRYFRKLGVRDFGTWNEANHKSQPTSRSPLRAAQYWKEMRRAVYRTCSVRSCRVVGLDVLDQRGVERYIDRFMAAAGRNYVRRYLRVVGVHNYSDVNRNRSSGLRSITNRVYRHTRRPNFWLTETGGIVRFASAFPCNERRAANRLTYLFRTTRNWRRHIQRVYLYHWSGGDCNLHFDAALTRADGTTRPGYDTVRRWQREFKR